MRNMSEKIQWIAKEDKKYKTMRTAPTKDLKKMDKVLQSILKPSIAKRGHKKVMKELKRRKMSKLS